MPNWLAWAQQIQAIAQSGLAFCRDVYDLERYEQLQRLAAEMMAAGTESEVEQVVAVFTQQTGYATPKVIGYKLSNFVNCQARNWLQFIYEKSKQKIKKHSPAYTGYSNR